jgi:general secretion pathway protein D
VKTISSLLLLAVLALRVMAQDAAPSPITVRVQAPPPPTNKEEVLRQALDRAYAELATNPPARTTRPPSRATIVTAPAASNAPAPPALPPIPTRPPRENVATSAPPAAPAASNVPPAAGAIAPLRPATATFGAATNPPAPTRAATNVVTAPAAQATNVVTAPGAAPATTPATNVVTAAPVTRPAAGPTLQPLTPGTRPATNGAAAAAAGQPGAPPAAQPDEAAAAKADETKRAEDDIIAAGEIKFQDADLSQVLDVYQELTGRTILRPTSLPQQKVSIRTQTQLTRKEAVQALDSILSLNGITMVPQGEKFVKALATAQAPQAGLIFYNADPEELPEAGQYVAYIAKLEYTDPTEIVPAIQPFASSAPSSIIAIKTSQTLVLRDYAENIKRMLEVIRKIDVFVPQEYKPVVIPIRYALANDIATVLSSLTAGGGGVTSVGQQAAGSSRFGLTGQGPGGTGFGAGGVGGVGTPGTPGYQQGVTPGIGGRTGYGATGVGAQPRQSFSQRLQQIVSRAASATGEIIVLGQTKIIADERTNSLLIFASDEDIETIKDIVSKLDVVLAQVLIEAIVMEVNASDRFQMGVSAVQHPRRIGSRLSIGGGFVAGPSPQDPFSLIASNLGSSAFTYFTKYQGNLDLALQLFASDSGAQVIQRPRIQTSHAVPCSIFIGQTEPYVTGTYGGYYGSGFGSQISQLRVGLQLDILPLINQDGLVVMDIQQRIDSVADFRNFENLGDIPVTQENTANAKVSVRDGEIVMLGGMIRNESRKSKSGVPFLKDIPLLGALFRGTDKSKSARELIILIRPTVLPTPEDAAIVAAEERSRMPGITAADREWGKDNEKRRAKAARELYRREGLEK